LYARVDESECIFRLERPSKNDPATRLNINSFARDINQ
jgi:hypothetical protein